ncbi:MAG: RNA polymerase sigma-70 factor [Chitinophagaceae bacterium]
MAKAFRDLTDEELLQQCGNDDVRAYNALFDRYVGKLHRMGVRYVRDQNAVEELVMEILLDIWDRRASVQLKGKLSSYLFQAMHNKAISYLRKAVPVMVDIADMDENSFVAANTTDQRINFRDAENILAEKLANLSPQRRKVFQLSRERGMTYADIANEMNLSQNTVRNHMTAALDYLREHYNDGVTTSFTIFYITILIR